MGKRKSNHKKNKNNPRNSSKQDTVTKDDKNLQVSRSNVTHKLDTSVSNKNLPSGKDTKNDDKLTYNQKVDSVSRDMYSKNKTCYKYNIKHEKNDQLSFFSDNSYVKGKFCETDRQKISNSDKQHLTGRDISQVKNKPNYPVKTEAHYRTEDNITTFDHLYGAKPKKGNSAESFLTQFPHVEKEITHANLNYNSYGTNKQDLTGKKDLQMVSKKSRDYVFMRECEYVYDAFYNSDLEEVDVSNENVVSEIKETNTNVLKDVNNGCEKGIKLSNPSNNFVKKQKSTDPVSTKYSNKAEGNADINFMSKRKSIKVSASKFLHTNEEICNAVSEDNSMEKQNKVRKDEFKKNSEGSFDSTFISDSEYAHLIPDPLYDNSFEENSCAKKKDKNDYRNSSSRTSYVEKRENFNPSWENFKGNVFTGIKAYKKSKKYFSSIYDNWRRAREETIKKLEILKKDLHDYQLNLNKIQMACREVGFVSRGVKSAPVKSVALDFLASVTAFLSDAASGITSVAQAVNVETYRSEFQEIMDNDAQITKDIYSARSQCVVEYHGIEEVIRKFKSNTLNFTVGEISNTLEISKFEEAVKVANQSNDMNEVVSLVGKFVSKACQPEVVGEIFDSVKTYVDDNPATLEACKSAGRAVFGVLDSLQPAQKKNVVGQQLSLHSNIWMMREDKNEIDRLQHTFDHDLSQTKLEDQIQEAIYSLESEMHEIIKSFSDEISDNDDVYSEFDYNYGDSDDYGDNDYEFQC